MILHVVLFRPAVPLDSTAAQDMLQTVIGAIARCPTVRACRVGRRVRHGLPGYEQAMRENYEIILLLEFDDTAGLTAYLQHPEHAGLAQVFASGSAALAYDYEMMALDG